MSLHSPSNRRQRGPMSGRSISAGNAPATLISPTPVHVYCHVTIHLKYLIKGNVKILDRKLSDKKGQRFSLNFQVLKSHT